MICEFEKKDLNT